MLLFSASPPNPLCKKLYLIKYRNVDRERERGREGVGDGENTAAAAFLKLNTLV